MSDSNLVPAPNAQRRRAAARRARVERRQRALTDQGADDGDNVPATVAPSGPPAPPPDGGTHTAVPAGPEGKGKPGPVDLLRPEAFVLPPRAQIDRASTRFGYFVKMTFFVIVAAPVFITMLFYAFVATDQYATESSFAVRGPTAQSQSIDLGGMLGLSGMASADAEMADSYILQQYIESREVVEVLIEEANFLEIYSRPSADGYYRLDPDSSIESLVSYWQMMCDVHYDADTGIITMIIRAFTPEDAEKITAKVIEKAEELVNDLSMRARADSVAAAQREVEIAEERYAGARTALAGYRGSEKEIDPMATAEARAVLVGELEGELARRESELSALSATMSDNSPRVQVVRNQIAALERQIATERLSVAVAEQGVTERVLTDRLNEYEALLAEREFAEKAYLSAMAMLEQARVEALKQQRYLAVFVRGAAPQDAKYPDGVRWTLITFAILMAAWGILALSAAAIRDQLS